MTTTNRPKPIKAISLREKRKEKEAAKSQLYYVFLRHIPRPRTLIGDEVED